MSKQGHIGCESFFVFLTMTNSSSILGHVAVPQETGYADSISCKPPQIGLLRGGTQATRRFGCPIEIEQFAQMPTAPQNGPDDGEQAGKTMLPRMRKGQIADQQVSQQAGPDLPLHGVGIMAEEIGQLNGLLDLLKEYLDIPATTIQFSDSPSAPLHVIRQKLKLAVLSIHLNQRNHPSQCFGIGLAGFRGDQFDDFIAQDPRVIGGVQGSNHSILHVVLGAADPEDALAIHRGQVVKIHISLIGASGF